jgi:hypothetical protein
MQELAAADELGRPTSNAKYARVEHAAVRTVCLTLGQRAAGLGLDRLNPGRPNKACAPKADHGSRSVSPRLPAPPLSSTSEAGSPQRSPPARALRMAVDG